MWLKAAKAARDMLAYSAMVFMVYMAVVRFWRLTWYTSEWNPVLVIAAVLAILVYVYFWTLL